MGAPLNRILVLQVGDPIGIEPHGPFRQLPYEGDEWGKSAGRRRDMAPREPVFLWSLGKYRLDSDRA